MLDVTVNAGEFEAEASPLIESAVLHALRSAREEVAEISVTLLADADIRALNREYLARDLPTDVIAFTLGEEGTLGDVYIGVDRARAQAADHGVGLEEELVRLAIHGTLHVLGHEHPEGPERVDSPMFEAQERLVREVLEAG